MDHQADGWNPEIGGDYYCCSEYMARPRNHVLHRWPGIQAVNCSGLTQRTKIDRCLELSTRSSVYRAFSSSWSRSLSPWTECNPHFIFECLTFPWWEAPYWHRMSIAKRSMTARLLPRLVLLATSFLLALMMLAPSQALAHAGHDHGIVDSSSETTPVKSIVPTTEPSRNSLPGTHAIVTVDAERLPASEVTSGFAPSKSKNCPGGCCQSAGAYCCPVTLLPASLSFTAPEKQLLVPPIVSRGAGITPGALSKPPRSLV